MGSIKDKAKYLLDTKTLFKATLTTLGTGVTDQTPFREYVKFMKDLVPKTETTVLGTMQIQTIIQSHMLGGEIVPLEELKNVYKIFQDYAALQTPELLKGD